MEDKVFITDCEQRKSIPIIRALGREGVTVIGGETSRWSMGFFSKYCSKGLIYPPPEDEAAFINWLIKQAEKGVFNILFPIDERTMKPVTRNLERLREYMVVPVVDAKNYQLADDKYQTYLMAEKAGLNIPKSWCFNTEDELKKNIDRINTPLVIKPRISSGSRGLRYIKDKKDLLPLYHEIAEKYPRPIVQEFIPDGGETLGVELLFNKGKPVIYFMHRRLREYPVKGGPSTLRESCKDKALIQKSIKLLELLNWHGLAMVEFKIDPRNNQPVFMEINPKFWGSIALPISAGVNFPYYLYQIAAGKDSIKQPDYEDGVLCRWLLPGDILHFISNPDRFKIQPGFFKFSGMHYDIISLKDWGPVWGMFVYFISKSINKEFWKNKIYR